VSGALADDLARLRAEPLDGVGLPGELFLGTPAGVPVEVTARGSRPSDGAAREAVADAVARVRATDGRLQAWVSLDGDAPAAAAVLDEEAAAGRRRGPLHGVPVGIKDLVDIAGRATGAGSRQWAGPGRERVPDVDAPVVGMLRAAGAVVLGKTRTHEFAFGGTTPPTRNPHDLGRIPGGSSGGSAAAVAAGHVPLALGTDTCGSVRIPSSYCGTVGLLPSAGLLPRDGVVPLARSLDRVGLIAADVAALSDAAAGLGIIGADAGPMALEGLRVGVPEDALDEPLDPAVGMSFAATTALLRAAGVRIVPVRLDHGHLAVTAGIVLFLAEGLEFHRARWDREPELFGTDVQGLLSLAEQVGAGDYVRAQRLRRALRDDHLAVLSSVDLLLTPTMPSGAPPVDQAASGVLVVGGREVGLAEAHLRFTVGASLAALPAGTQPMRADADGLPLGVQWIGRPGDDATVVAAMAALETLTGPPVPAAGARAEVRT
jgi:aspartyl-tRNA(Asn)/glutamyl-tRNA(Gln) amidotransferase subunit A